MKRIFCILAISGFITLSAQSEVTFYTSMGDFVVELHDSIMPITTGNFMNLVASKGYDGKRFYRVVANFVIQGGYRTNLPPAIPDEFDSTGLLSNRRWTLSMANSGPNTGSSEIFINLKDNLFLDWNKAPLTSAHPVFGKVISGWTVVSDIGGVAVDANEQPLVPVVMDSLRITSTPLSTKAYSDPRLECAIYPNPANAQSLLHLRSPSGGSARIVICDPSGRIVHDEVRTIVRGTSLIPVAELGLSGVNSGFYFIEIITGNNAVTEKLWFVDQG